MNISRIVKKNIKIQGMHCSSCAMMIDGDLEDLEGVKSAKTSYARSESEIEYDADKVSEEGLLEVISKNGYSGTIQLASVQKTARPSTRLA